MCVFRRDVSRKVICYPLSIDQYKLSNICIIRGQMTVHVDIDKTIVSSIFF